MRGLGGETWPGSIRESSAVSTAGKRQWSMGVLPLLMGLGSREPQIFIRRWMAMI